MAQGQSVEPAPSAALIHLPAPAPASDPVTEDDAEGRLSDVDHWGRSAKVRQAMTRIYGPLYDHWFRAEWEGLEKIPTSGGALLVANHAGALPVDAPLIMHGIETELGRPVYGLADYFFRGLPVLGTLWSRGGGVPAHPDNAYRLLADEAQLALVFPEGTKATGKLWSERYKLRRFGRGGFVEIAMRSGVPVVPIVVIGSEETMPMMAKSPTLARALGLPYVPLTLNMMLFGPLGMLLYLPAKIRFRVLDPITFDVEPHQERYPRSVIFDQAEQIRQTMQREIYDMLSHRRSIWFG